MPQLTHEDQLDLDNALREAIKPITQHPDVMRREPGTEPLRKLRKAMLPKSSILWHNWAEAYERKLGAADARISEALDTGLLKDTTRDGLKAKCKTWIGRSPEDNQPKPEEENDDAHGMPGVGAEREGDGF